MAGEHCAWCAHRAAARAGDREAAAKFLKVWNEGLVQKGGEPSRGVPVADRVRSQRKGGTAVHKLKEGKPKMSKKQRHERELEALIKSIPSGRGVSLAGGATTASSRVSDADLTQMVADGANSQTFARPEPLAFTGANQPSMSHAGTGADTARLRAVEKGFDERVVKAQAALASSRNEFETMRADAELRSALKSRAMMKMIVTENARRQGRLPMGRFGPNSADLFGGSSLTLPDDRQIGGI